MFSCKTKRFLLLTLGNHMISKNVLTHIILFIIQFQKLQKIGYHILSTITWQMFFLNQRFLLYFFLILFKSDSLNVVLFWKYAIHT